MSRFGIFPTPIAGLVVVERQAVADSRGSLSRIFCANELELAGWNGPVAQINHTVTAHAGTIRGLHFQVPPFAESKLVSCLRGEVWDVAVDLRRGSATFLQWHAVHLSAANKRALLIPRGFAHGFQCLASGTELLYLHSEFYAPGNEGGLNPLDPALSIPWPIPAGEMSLRDQNHPMITNEFDGLHL